MNLYDFKGIKKEVLNVQFAIANAFLYAEGDQLTSANRIVELMESIVEACECEDIGLIRIYWAQVVFEYAVLTDYEDFIKF